MTWAGRPLQRFEDDRLLRGRGRFTGDLKADRHVRFVRSGVAAGRIRAIEAPDGAVVIAAADLDGVRPMRAILHRPDYAITDWPLLACDVVRFVGEPVAAVIAETEAEAEDIADQVFVDIEPHDAVVEMDDALAEGAPLVHEAAAGNVFVKAGMETPDFEAAFAAAAAVVEVRIRSRRQSAMPMETRCAVAVPHRSSDRITLTCGTQAPHVARTAIADILGMPENDLHVMAPDVGGAFGQKVALPPEYAVVVWLARRFGVSVKWIEDRRENLMSGFHSRDQQVLVRGAFDGDGRLRAVDADVSANVGAYSAYPLTCAVEPLMAMREMPGPYRFSGYRAAVRGVATNTCPMAPYRGVSRPVVSFSMERLMDTAAARLGIDRVEIRRRNLVDAFPYTTPSGALLDEASYVACLEKAVAVADLPRFAVRQKRARREGRYLGLGFSVFNESTAFGTSVFKQRGMDLTPGYETVELSMDPSGHVEVRIGTSPHGQGLATSLSQLVADELGTVPSRVRVVHGDTDRTPYGWGTFASRSMAMSGGAAVLAARKVREKLLKAAGHLLEAASEDLDLVDGSIGVRGTDRAISLEEVARAAYHGTHRLGPGFEPGLSDSAVYDPGGTYSNACHLVEAEVETETGRVRLHRYVVVEDAGRLINPLIVDGQIMGGVVQGIANSMFEEIVYDEAGNIITVSLADYRTPTAAEIPHIEIHHLVTDSPETLTKAKGLGEGGTIGAPGAIVNAINDALTPFGVVFDEFPVTPPRIRARLREAAGSRQAAE